MDKLHDKGYAFVGDKSITRLTISEIRVLEEGMYQNAEAEKRERKLQQKTAGKPGGVSETRRDIEKSRQQSDKEFVEDLAA